MYSKRFHLIFVIFFFSELGVVDGVIIARTDSLGASLTQKIPVVKELGDLPSRLVIMTFLKFPYRLKKVF